VKELAVASICLKDKSAEIPQVKPNGGSFRSVFFHHKEPHSKPGQLKLIGRIETCLVMSSPVCAQDFPILYSHDIPISCAQPKGMFTIQVISIGYP
jgi:hypothetical protein